VTNSAEKSNPCPSTKAAGDFWNEGNGHQPSTLLYLCAKNFRSFVHPEISLDEKKYY